MTLKTNRLVLADFADFIDCYKPDDIRQREESVEESGEQGRWKMFTYDEVVARDKTNLDLFWLKDDSLEDTENLPAPAVLAAEIVEQLQAALIEFESVEAILGSAS